MINVNLTARGEMIGAHDLIIAATAHSLLEQILGKGLIDAKSQRVRHELFSPEKQDELIEALIAPSPEIAATRQATESEDEQEVDIDEDGMEFTDEE